jgi:peptide/nickel transport system permease protein
MSLATAPVGAATAARVLKRRPRTFRVGLALAWFVIAVLVLCAVFGSAITPHNPLSMNIRLANLPPGTAAPSGLPFLLGTDLLGRDLLSRIMIGARITLLVGLASIVVSGTTGVALGLIAGYHEGRIGQIIMRVVDVQLGIPTILIALLLVFVLGSNALNVIIALSLTRWPIYVRITRGLVLTIREQLFVDALITMGARDGRILFRHILPNAIRPLIVTASFELSALVLSESSISFLGLGIQPPDISWGVLLSQGREFLTSQWWLVTFPGVAILLVSLAFNIVAVRAYESNSSDARGKDRP